MLASLVINLHNMYYTGNFDAPPTRVTAQQKAGPKRACFEFLSVSNRG